MIDLPRLVDTGKIYQIDTPASEMSRTIQKFDHLFVKGLHQGEIEALAYLRSNKKAGISFSTGDKMALQAAAMLDIAYLVVSLEEILSSIGFQKPIDHQFTKSYCDRYLDKGHQNKILGRGLSNT